MTRNDFFKALAGGVVGGSCLDTKAASGPELHEVISKVRGYSTHPGVGVPFSKQHADAACNFFEKILKHTADEYWGKPFILAPWQERALSAIFGNVDEDGNRLIEMAFIESVKKSGKTEFCAGLVLFVLTTTPTPGCQCYGAASATRQAMNVYRAACKMVEQSPILSKHLRIMRGTNRIVKRKDPDSFFAAVAADGDFGDGVNPAFVVADEVHRWKTRKQIENWDVLSKGGITRRQTLTVAITTAGVQNESPLAWRLHEKTRKIQDGIVSDPRFYGVIYAADKEDDPGDPKTWIKANPSLIDNGGFLPIEKIRKEYESAVSEGDLTSFKRYFLNIWDQKENRAIDLAKWDACEQRWQARGLLWKPPEDAVRPLHPDLERYLIDRPCWAGVDLSMTTDLSAVTLVFPRDDDGIDVLPFVWVPQDGIRKLELRLGMPLQQWAREGWIEVCPGNVIDYRDIQARLEWAGRMFDLQEICWDPWNAAQISVPMIEAGYRCVDIRQGFATLSEPTKKTLALIADGKFGHGGHPVTRWCASCCSLAYDRKDNIMFAKPERGKSSGRIDVMAAAVNALVRVILGQTNRAIYSDPDQVVI